MPIILGHEIIGDVVALGRDSDQGYSIQIRGCAIRPKKVMPKKLQEAAATGSAMS